MNREVSHLLVRGLFDHQTAARPKPAKHDSEPEPKQVKHGNQVIADRLCRLPCEVVDFTAGQDCDEGQDIEGAQTSGNHSEKQAGQVRLQVIDSANVRNCGEPQGLPILSLYSLSSSSCFLELYRGDPNPDGRSVCATTTAKTELRICRVCRARKLCNFVWQRETVAISVFPFRRDSAQPAKCHGDFKHGLLRARRWDRRSKLS